MPIGALDPGLHGNRDDAVRGVMGCHNLRPSSSGLSRGFNPAAAIGTFYPLSGKPIPTHSVTPVAMQTGVQSTLMVTGDAHFIRLALRYADTGIGPRFALRQAHGNRDDAVRGVMGCHHLRPSF